LFDDEADARARDRVQAVRERHPSHVDAPAARIDQEQRALSRGGEVEQHAGDGRRRLAGRRDRGCHVLGGHRRFARGRDRQAFRGQHLAQRRLEQLDLVRRRADDHVDRPARALGWRRQRDPCADHKERDAAEK